MRGFAWLVGASMLAACSRPSCCSEPSVAPVPRAQRSSSFDNADQEPPPSRASEDQLLKRVKLRRGSKDVTYVPPNEQELADFSHWFRELLLASQAGNLPALSAARGFEVEAHDDNLWFLAERGDQRRGAGLYVLRSGRAESWVIQAPHTHFDMGTLEIALTCFEVLNARALLINTVRRTASGDDELETADRAMLARSGRADSDLAHAERSFFNTAHAVLATVSENTAIQLHGFRDEHAPGVGLVLSASGTELRLEPIANALSDVIAPHTVKRYPAQIAILGGMKNAQGRHSRNVGSSFLHVEIARSLRERLREDTAYRQRFAGGLLQGLVSARGPREGEVKPR